MSNSFALFSWYLATDLDFCLNFINWSHIHSGICSYFSISQMPTIVMFGQPRENLRNVISILPVSPPINFCQGKINISRLSDIIVRLKSYPKYLFNYLADLCIWIWYFIHQVWLIQSINRKYWQMSQEANEKRYFQSL